MNLESHSVTLKIWDRSAIDPTLEEAIAHVSAKSNTHRDHIKVTRSGPDVFTVHVAEDLA